VISTSRVIDGTAVMKAEKETARQAEEEAHPAAVRAEAKEQRAAARVEAARVKAARAVATKAQGKGKAVVADASVTPPKLPRRSSKLVSKSQREVGDAELLQVAVSYPAYPLPATPTH
jgi:hypothetical protein